jgi:hypothetical protein
MIDTSNTLSMRTIDQLDYARNNAEVSISTQKWQRFQEISFARTVQIIALIGLSDLRIVTLQAKLVKAIHWDFFRHGLVSVPFTKQKMLLIKLEMSEKYWCLFPFLAECDNGH